MKIITYSRIGYNHPRQANWSYGIFKIDLIDTKQNYVMSYVVKENFGGDSRLVTVLKELGYSPIESKAVQQLPKITGVSKMLDMEDKELLTIIIDFMKNK